MTWIKANVADRRQAPSLGNLRARIPMSRRVGKKRYEFLRSILARRKEAKQHDNEWTTHVEERLKALEDLRRMRRSTQFIPYF